MKRYIADDKAEIRPEEQSEKAESCRENLWNEMQLGHINRNNTQKQNKKEWVSSVDLCQT